MDRKNLNNINLNILARNKESITTSIITSDLAQAASLTSSKDAKIHADFDFKYLNDAEKEIVLDGIVKSKLDFVCQRCNGKVSYKIDSKLKLVFVNSGSDIVLPNVYIGYDIYELKDFENFNIQDLIEEEILLSIPIIPKHPADGCSLEYKVGEVEEVINNPFTHL